MTITAQFRDGPLAGQSLDVDLEKHDHTDRKTGSYYVRVTERRGTEPQTYFVLRETLYAKTK